MLTPYLEKLIHQGKAKFRTYVCGLSGSNVLPVSENSWAIITGFTYYNFSDPAFPILASDFDAYVERSLHQLRFRSSFSNNHYVIKDDVIRAPGSPGSDINLIVNGDFSSSINWSLVIGWSIGAGVALSTGIAGFPTVMNYVPYAILAGRTYRLTYDVVTIVGAGSVQAALGQSFGFIRTSIGTFTEEITVTDIGAALLIFTGALGIGNNASIDNVELILLPSEDTVIINGHSKFDCYLPHKKEVSVELVAFDTDVVIELISQAAPASFPIPVPPLGYGNFPFVGSIAQLTELRNGILGGGLRAYNLPMTRLHTDPTGIVAGEIVLNGMEIPVTAITAINTPGITGQGRRDFPIVDIQYVEISENMPGNIQASS